MKTNIESARLEPQAERILLANAWLAPSQILRGQKWVSADGSGIVAIIDSVANEDVYYTVNGGAYSKSVFQFQVRYCLSILGN